MQTQTTETKSLPAWQRPVITHIDISRVTLATSLIDKKPSS